MIKPFRYFFFFIVISVGLVFSHCGRETKVVPTPLSVTMKFDSSSAYKLPLFHSSLLMDIKNNSQCDVLIRVSKLKGGDFSFIRFDDLFFFSGSINSPIRYQGPLPIAERILVSEIDTIPSGQQKTFLFDPLYAGSITDSVSYIFFSIPINSTFFDSLNSEKKLIYHTYRDNQIKYPFYVFKYDKLDFTNVTSQFIQENTMLFKDR